MKMALIGMVVAASVAGVVRMASGSHEPDDRTVATAADTRHEGVSTPGVESTQSAGPASTPSLAIPVRRTASLAIAGVRGGGAALQASTNLPFSEQLTARPKTETGVIAGGMSGGSATAQLGETAIAMALPEPVAAAALTLRYPGDGTGGAKYHPGT